MKISYIMRSPSNHTYSIEKVFSSIIPVVSRKNETEMIYMPYFGVNPKSIFYNLKTAKKCNGDIIHITGDVHYVALITPMDRTVITVHDMVTLENKNWLKKTILKLFWFTLPLNRCKKIVAISEKTKNDLIKHYPHLENKIVVVPDPVDESYSFFPKEFNEECPHLLQIGTKRNKNILRVVEALKGIKCILHVVGKLNDKQIEALEKYNIKYDYCYHISEKELIEKYRTCDMVIFASTFEGFGMPIIEAQTVGRPVVTSAIEPMITVSGPEACLVDPYSVESIRAGILNIIRDEDYRKKIVLAGIRNASKYSAKSIGEKYMNVYTAMEE